MANFIGGIISLSVSAVILAGVFIYSVKNYSSCVYGNCSSPSNSGNWSASESAMWGLLSLIAVVGMLYGVLNVFGIA